MRAQLNRGPRGWGHGTRLGPEDNKFVKAKISGKMSRFKTSKYKNAYSYVYKKEVRLK